MGHVQNPPAIKIHPIKINPSQNPPDQNQPESKSKIYNINYYDLTSL